jgi:small-conductance mechanosensitive channel
VWRDAAYRARSRAGWWKLWTGRASALATLVLIAAETSFGAEPSSVTALQREIEDTRDIAAEVLKAVPRVEQENAELGATLSAAARDLSAADISAPMLQAAGLDVDAVRSHLRTLDNRIEQREAALGLLDQEIEQYTSSVRQMPTQALVTLAAEAEHHEQRELRAIVIELIEGLRRLRDAEAEHLALVEERLALLQSRIELRAIRDNSGFDQDPRIVALRAIVSRLTRDSTRLANQAAAIPPSSTADRIRRRLLELQADDAIARGTLRLADLDLLRIQSHIDFLDDLVDDLSIPVRVLRAGRLELDNLQAQLDDRLMAFDEERRAVAGWRKRIVAQEVESSALISSQVDSLQGLEELVDFQQADVLGLRERITRAAERLDVEVGERALTTLGERRRLPMDPVHRELLSSQLALMPSTISDYWYGLARTLGARLANASLWLVALAAGAIIVLVAAAWWLYRTGLRWLVAVSPGSLLSIPIEALRQPLPLLLPAIAWLVLASVCKLDSQTTWLIAGVLALWPLVGLVLRANDLLAEKRPDRSVGANSWGRMALIAAAGVGTVVPVIRAAPILPSLADVVERAGFLALALAAIGAWSVRKTLLEALRDTSGMSAAAQRFLEIATLAGLGLLALAAVAGLSGWVELGWTIAAALGAVLVATGALAVVAKLIKARIGRRRRRDRLAIDAIYRLAVVVLAVGTAWLLVGIDARSANAQAAFWIGAIACALPFVLQPAEALVAWLLGIDPERRPDGSVSVLAICVDRGVRALLIIGAALGIAWILDLDLAAFASGDTLQTRIVRGVFNIALVALIADFVWHLAKTMIDERLAAESEGEAPSEAGGEGGGQGASRLRTLLPLLRKFLMITLAVMVIMLVLSSLGVDIGPLLAGAGVVGLAIGFGAQTLVRDIVSGVFFLMDDAFRLGEYVDVGAAKGTVEHISIRSLRLRHHRGALHTIPFGEITTLSNYSRDWVIMKLEFRVPYDTDMQQVKKIFKKIGAEMMADPELGPNLLDPPKSQGVFQMDDSAMIVRAKFMAKPGEQFIIRRELYHRAQKAFEAAGIEFARRQVSVFVPPGADPQAAAAAVAAAEEEQTAGEKAKPAAE